MVHCRGRLPVFPGRYAFASFREHIHQHRDEFCAVHRTTDEGPCFIPAQMGGPGGCETFWTSETSIREKFLLQMTFLWGFPDSSQNMCSSQKKNDLQKNKWWDLNPWTMSIFVFLCCSFNTGFISRGNCSISDFFIILRREKRERLGKGSVALSLYQLNRLRVSWW